MISVKRSFKMITVKETESAGKTQAGCNWTAFQTGYAVLKKLTKCMQKNIYAPLFFSVKFTSLVTLPNLSFLFFRMQVHIPTVYASFYQPILAYPNKAILSLGKTFKL